MHALLRSRCKQTALYWQAERGDQAFAQSSNWILNEAILLDYRSNSFKLETASFSIHSSNLNVAVGARNDDRIFYRHLKNCEVHEQVINWIQDFLSDRTQVVRYNGTASSTEPVLLSGILQGTVIGPVSFLSFINDLPDEMLSRIFLFADDTQLYRAISLPIPLMFNCYSLT